MGGNYTSDVTSLRFHASFSLFSLAGETALTISIAGEDAIKDSVGV